MGQLDVREIKVNPRIAIMFVKNVESHMHISHEHIPSASYFNSHNSTIIKVLNLHIHHDAGEKEGNISLKILDCGSSTESNWFLVYIRKGFCSRI